jgi:hypothetical protein
MGVWEAAEKVVVKVKEKAVVKVKEKAVVLNIFGVLGLAPQNRKCEGWTQRNVSHQDHQDHLHRNLPAPKNQSTDSNR